MRAAAAGTGSSLIARAVTYLAFGYADGMPVGGRMAVAVAVLLAGLLLTALAAQRPRKPRPGGSEVSIADGVRSAGKVSVDGVKAGGAAHTTVARRVFGLIGVTVSKVEIRTPSEEDERP